MNISHPVRMLVIVLSATLSVAGCSSSGGTERYPSEKQAAGDDAVRAFADLERRLLEAESITLRFAVTATGMFPTSFTGTVRVEKSNVLDLEATGEFAEMPTRLRLRSNGTMMRGANGERVFESPTPAYLNEAVVIGMCRMGILHNLARLVMGSPPDHADGGVREWVRADSLRVPGVDESAGNGSPDADIEYDLIVDGERSALVRLWMNDDGTLPARRTLHVQFDGGEMKVEEKYEFVE